MVKNLPAMQETRVQSLGWKESLEKEMATHSSILAWETPWTEEAGGLQSMGRKRVGHNLVTNGFKGKKGRNSEELERGWGGMEQMKGTQRAGGR